MKISFSSKGNFDKTTKFLRHVAKGQYLDVLSRYGQKGCDALANATPRDSGLTAESWRFKVIRNKGRTGIVWYNTHKVDGKPVAILLQYGHGTGTGGYVKGRDYINPAIKPIFDQIDKAVWKEVTKK